MLDIKKFDTFAVQSSLREACLSVATVVVLGAPVWASAAGTDKLVPVELAADAPGMIRFDTCARPVYPEQEAKQNHQGKVTLRFLVGSDGNVKESKVMKSSGYPALDDAALVAISKCSFNPPVANGKLVDAWVPVQYDWKPQ
ncbi:energy transducer TonB [Massilia sp. CMS3.1]|uniref:energy transducer TonB n=1 Tax=Massilia sp. CMS3.1 TaxID=3373083 RepID=UPI003EE640FB